MSAPDEKRRLSDWFRQWRLPLRKFLLSRVGIGTADVDDVAQEVFLRLMRYDRAELIEHPKAYMYKVASNVAAEWSIRTTNRSRLEARWIIGLVDEAPPDSLVIRAQSQEKIKQALARLQPRQREVLKLYFMEDLGHAAIAERTGQTLRSVRRHFARGYERLRRELHPELLETFEEGAASDGSD